MSRQWRSQAAMRATTALLLLLGLCCAQSRAEPVRTSIDAIMLRVLAGDPRGALELATSIRADNDDDMLDKLQAELEDLNRGDYATTGNRAFPALKPLWQQATQQWLATRQLPGSELPSVVLALPDAVARVLLVDTQQSAAWLLERALVAGEERWQTRAGYYISTGANGVDKRRRGDRRTPVGVYYPIDSIDVARLPARYGSHVLTLDYPNGLDASQGRTGDGIWLHGIDPGNNIRPPRDTDGCIAFDNGRIAELVDMLDLHGTPVVIADSFEWQRGASLEREAAALRDALLAWRDAQLSGDAGQLFALYADGYARHGLSSPMWRENIRARISARLFSDIAIDDVEIFVADADEEIYLTRFRQSLHRDGRAAVTTVRRLYWQRTEAGLRIVAEQNG